jgi:hypothetical protein
MNPRPELAMRLARVADDLFDAARLVRSLSRLVADGAAEPLLERLADEAETRMQAGLLGLVVVTEVGKAARAKGAPS